jgi:hypothetical protein
VRLQTNRESAEKEVKGLNLQVQLDATRFKRATIAAKTFTHKTLLVAKSRIQKADEEAAEMVRAAIAKSKQIKLLAVQEAKSAVSKAVHQATVHTHPWTALLSYYRCDLQLCVVTLALLSARF